MEKNQNPRNFTEAVIAKTENYQDLNAPTQKEGDEKFNELAKKAFDQLAVHGVLQFDPKEGKQVLKSFTDLDGKSTIEILKIAGISPEKISYIKPGEKIEGALNVDTGNKYGVVYEKENDTTIIDHHEKGEIVTSAAQIAYETLVDLGMLEKSSELDRTTDFITKIDNRLFDAEEFTRSAKTILGLQRDLTFEKLVEYFKDHKSATEELSPEEFEKYGLREAAEKQQKVVDESLEKLDEMIGDGKMISAKYGYVLVNVNNELKTGASAAYTKCDGIINFAPGKSFAVTLKDENFNEAELKEELGDLFQGKIIRGKMWIYNDKEPLKLDLSDIIEAIEGKRICTSCNGEGEKRWSVNLNNGDGMDSSYIDSQECSDCDGTGEQEIDYSIFDA